MTLALLEQDIPGLTGRVERLAPGERERLALAAVELALLVRPIDDPRVAAALEALRTGSEHPPDELQRLIDETENRYGELYVAWDQARDDEPGSEREQALRRSHVEAQQDASALAALRAALNMHTDPAAIGDVLYEAAYAVGYAPEAIGALVEAVEDGLADPVKHARRRLASGEPGPTDPGPGPEAG